MKLSTSMTSPPAQARARGPRACQALAKHPLKLADVPERERPQKRPQRRGRWHPAQ